MKIDLSQHDLVTPDGKIVSLTQINESEAEIEVVIESIHPTFVGFDIDPCLIMFNLKSTLAQIGLNTVGNDCHLDPQKQTARIKTKLVAIGPIAREMLTLVTVGSYIGKLFAADDRRRVRDPEYLSRMFGRSDRRGRPLLSLGGMHGSDSLILEKVDGRTVAYISLQQGKIIYEASIFGFLQTTKARAKEVQRMAEKIVTIARKGYDFNTIRRIQKELPYDQKAVVKMIKEIAPKYVSRHGGYTRVIPMGKRMSDTAEVARLEWV